jgi:hypothetical protein
MPGAIDDHTDFFIIAITGVAPDANATERTAVSAE